MYKKVMAVLVSALIVTLLMPRRATLDVHFSPGEIWDGESLVAPFDIPIYKTDEQIGRERRELLEGFQPVFRLDTTLVGDRLRTLRYDLAEQGLSAARQDTIYRTIEHIYQSGVLAEADKQNYIDKVIRIDSLHYLQPRFAVLLYTPSSSLTLLEQRGISPAYGKYIAPSLSYDASLNVRLREQSLQHIASTEGVVRSGEVIVSQGEMVDSRIEMLLASFRREYENRSGYSLGSAFSFIGRWILIAVLLTMNYIFFRYFSRGQFIHWRPMLFVQTLYLLMAVLMALVVQTPVLSPYLVPLPVVGIWLLAFFDTRTAIFGNTLTALLASFFVHFSFEFFTINFVAGMVAIFMVRHAYTRYSVLRAAAGVVIVEALLYTAFRWATQGHAEVSYLPVFWFVGNATLLLALYQLIYVFERIFGFVSDATLLEFSDTNHPILMQLAEKAPGTFQHSLQVASLVELAAKEIGANPLLARTGALYHDIGKMQNPLYFSENQMGDFNPHSMLTPSQSAEIVRRHVTDGAELARRSGIPASIQEFITGHHGTAKIYYFYAEELRQQGAVEHPEEFCYPGPKPVRREVALCMMADGVEAASRSLGRYDRASIDELVERVIDLQIAEHQLSQSDLSLAEVTRVKELFKIRLNNIYHGRVAYPTTLPETE